MVHNKLSILLIALLAGSVATPADAALGRPTTAPRTGVMAFLLQKCISQVQRCRNSRVSQAQKDIQVAHEAFSTTPLPTVLKKLIAEFLPETDLFVHTVINKETTTTQNQRWEGYPFRPLQKLRGIKDVTFYPLPSPTVEILLQYEDKNVYHEGCDGYSSGVIHHAIVHLHPDNQLAQLIQVSVVGPRRDDTIGTKFFIGPQKKNVPLDTTSRDKTLFADIAIQNNGTQVAVHVYWRDRTNVAVRGAFPPPLQAALPAPLLRQGSEGLMPAAPSDLPIPAAAAAAAPL
jgi:hypothetical protein